MAFSCLSAYALENGYFALNVIARKLFVMVITHGDTARSVPRLQKVWTPKQQKQRKIVYPERIETVSLVVPFQENCRTEIVCPDQF